VDDAQHGIDKVTLTIDGGEYGDRSYSWTGSVVPDDFIWDRHFGEIIAPIGDYPVTVRARDGLGNISTALGEIVIPNPSRPPSRRRLLLAPVGDRRTTVRSPGMADRPYPLPSRGPDRATGWGSIRPGR
jgi:hypothetical protein